MKYLLLLLLSGCAMIEPEWVVIDDVNMLVSPEPQLDCERYFKMGIQFTGYHRYGCHTKIGGQHYIIVDGSRQVFEHEIKHVTNGYFHP